MAALDRRLIQLSPGAENVPVAPGSQASVTLTIYNPSSIVENIRLEVLGAASSWATLSADHVNLFPRTTGEVTLTFRPSADAPPEAGEVPFGVKATPQHEPASSETDEGTVTVAALPRIAVPELIPANSHGYRRGRHRLLVQNSGNLDVPVRVSGTDPDGLLSFALRPSPFVLGYKEARLVRLRVRAPRYLVTGSNRQHRFALTLSADGIPDVNIPATFIQRPLLSRRLLTALAALATIALLGYFLFKPVLKSTAQARASSPTTLPLRTATPGPAGQRGTPGAPGTPGIRGTTGPTGATGTTGAAGAQGPRGLTGRSGLTGAPGPAGGTGAKGAIGPSGVRGLAGPIGSQGPPGATGPQGPPGVIKGYQQALTTGSTTFSSATAIVKTPQLPPGNYAVMASLGVSSGTGYGGTADCWTTPDSSGVDNTDHVRAEAFLSTEQTLSVNDIWSVTKSPDSIDLVCESTATATATNATIIAFPLTSVTQTTVSGSTAQ